MVHLYTYVFTFLNCFASNCVPFCHCSYLFVSFCICLCFFVLSHLICPHVHHQIPKCLPKMLLSVSLAKVSLHLFCVCFLLFSHTCLCSYIPFPLFEGVMCKEVACQPTVPPPAKGFGKKVLCVNCATCTACNKSTLSGPSARPCLYCKKVVHCSYSTQGKCGTGMGTVNSPAVCMAARCQKLADDDKK